MEKNNTKKHKRKRKGWANIVFVTVVALLLIQSLHYAKRIQEYVGGEIYSDVSFLAEKNGTATAENIVTVFAAEHGLQVSQYPKELIELLARNPEAEEFVLNYPLKKDLTPVIDLSSYEDCDEVPLLLQWDERWGYDQYGADVMGLSGCGPTCLSMVSIYLLQNTDYDPRYVADFSEANGYCVPGNGSAWTLISEGGKKLGLDVEELSLNEDMIIQNLESGNPIICVMGPGDFTTSGHFIVMVDYVDGKIKVNDPNSRVRSETLWEYEAIKGQIRNLWVCRKEM